MKALTLTTLAVGSVGTAVGLNYYLGGETIKDHITRTINNPNKVFLTTQTKGLSDITAKYKDSKRTKPQENGEAVKETEIAKWCQNAVNQKFWDAKSSNYEGILSWCYINTNDFKTELANSKKEILSANAEDHQDWKTAWQKYKAGRDKEGSKIKEETNLNNDDETEGGKALKKWCNAKKDETKKLYEDGIEEAFKLFVQWCSKDKTQ